MAIAEFLEEAKPFPSLLPKDLIKRAQIRAFCEMINSGIQPLQNLKVMNKVEQDYKGDKIAWVKYFVSEGLACKDFFVNKNFDIFFVLFSTREIFGKFKY